MAQRPQSARRQVPVALHGQFWEGHAKLPGHDARLCGDVHRHRDSIPPLRVRAVPDEP